MPLRLAVVSDDRELAVLCQQTLAEVNRSNWLLHLVGADEQPDGFDLYVWDFKPGMHIMNGIFERELHRHLFLVRRNVLGDFRAEVRNPLALVVLKPVSRTTLRTMLTRAISGVSASPASADRAEPDHRDPESLMHAVANANLKLQEYDHERTQFLARAVHDFRAPLTAISGYCGILLSEELGTLTEEQREILRRMETSSERLSRMTDAMLRLSIGRLQGRKPHLQRNDIRSCVERSAAELFPLTNRSNISVSIELLPPSNELRYENAQLEQVLVNLIDNACRFTPRGGRIRIKGYSSFWDRRSPVQCCWPRPEFRTTIAHTPNVYRIDVEDAGDGIPDEDLENIFEEYTCSTNLHGRSGTGLGLAICRMIMTQHGGHIWAENIESGGARLALVLPFLGPQSESDDNEALPQVMGASLGDR